MSKLAIVLCTILFASTFTSGSNDPRADVCAEENKVQFDLSYAEIPYINEAINCTLPYKRLVVTRVFSKTKNVFIDALAIPRGATNIVINEIIPSYDSEYLDYQNAILNEYSGFINDSKFAGTIFNYARKPQDFSTSLTVTADGPTSKTTYVGLFSERTNVSVHYEYVSNVKRHLDIHAWVVDHFSANYLSYVKGLGTSKVKCVRRRDNETGDVHLCGVIDNENCNASHFGCCPDYTTAARGSNNKGCLKIPTNIGDACGLRSDRGHCWNWTFVWYFDTDHGFCRQFHYSGCGGNDNIFKTEEECNKVCVQPKGRDACILPKVSGPCNESSLQWYYDRDLEQCDEFLYKGCDGNNNRFETRKQCEDFCAGPIDVALVDSVTIYPTNRTEYTEGSELRFDCSAQDYPKLEVKWYKDDKAIYQDDRIKISKSPNTLVITNATSNDTGTYMCNPTNEVLINSDEIDIFVDDVHQYDDIDKDNRTASHFGSNSDGRHIIHSDPGANCSIQGDVQTCANITDVWFFDTNYDICARSYYGGCGGKGNNFTTEEECNTNCVESKGKSSDVEKWTLI